MYTPPGFTKEQRCVLKQRAESYEVRGKANGTVFHYVNVSNAVSNVNAIHPLDGELYYFCRRKQDEQQHHYAKVVSNPEEANWLFVHFHAGPHGEHCGVDRTLHAILQRFWWPGIKEDITGGAWPA